MRGPIIVALSVTDPVVEACVNHDSVFIQQHGNDVGFLIEPIWGGDGVIDTCVAALKEDDYKDERREREEREKNRERIE